MTAASKIPSAPFSGGDTLMKAGGALGVLGLLGMGVGFAQSPKQFYFSYLTAYLYVLSICLGGLSWVMIFQASKARWSVVIRRWLENMGGGLVLMTVLFIPVALGMKQLYPWMTPEAWKGNHHFEHLIHHRHGYMNAPFFLARSVGYLLIFVLIGELQLGWSRKQDKEGGIELSQKQRRLGAGGIPFFGLAITFAAFDWLMSLHLDWFSTVFGAHYIIGGLISSISLLAIVLSRVVPNGTMGDAVGTPQFHNVGKFMLAFTCFWAYLGFSQYMLTYVAHLPEEIPWFVIRTNTSWASIGKLLIIGHFILPFLILLSRDLKEKPARLALVGFWMLFIHFIDIHFQVMPALHPTGANFHWMDLAAVMGLGGITLAFVTWRSRGHAPLPVRDPYLAYSMEYYTGDHSQ
jgi:hypothetical protein